MHRKTQQSEQEMSGVADAQGYLGRLIELECNGWGDQANALSRVARKASLNPWTLDRIRTGRAKTVTVEVMAGLRSAYVAMCERQIAKLQHELAVEKAKKPDDDFQDFDAAIAALAARIAAKRKGTMQ